jgi:hypothetical protein
MARLGEGGSAGGGPVGSGPVVARQDLGDAQPSERDVRRRPPKGGDLRIEVRGDGARRLQDALMLPGQRDGPPPHQRRHVDAPTVDIVVDAVLQPVSASR